MKLTKAQKVDLKAAIVAGTAAGIISGFVKLGWENVLPPRTPERDAVNPPQTLMEQAGIPQKITRGTYSYSGHKMPWASFLMHFGFSTSFAIIYEVLSEYSPFIRKGSGAILV